MAGLTAARTRAATAPAAVLAAPGRFDVGHQPVPEPPAGQVLVRIEGCGVCASSLPLWQGRPWFSYPLAPGAPGHEGWGVVESRGEGADPALLGRRVALLSQGAFARYDLAAADEVVTLPPELDGLPFPGEAFACVVNAFGRSDVRPGDTVAIVGMGFFGSAFAQLARAAGAEVVEVRRGDDWSRWSEGCDRVVEAAGTQEALDAASALVRPRGRLVVAGFHQDGARTVDLQSWNWRGLDVVNAHEREPRRYVDGMREAARLAAAGSFDLEALVTQRFPLAQIDAAFDAATAREPGFVKAWVAP